MPTAILLVAGDDTPDAKRGTCDGDGWLTFERPASSRTYVLHDDDHEAVLLGPDRIADGTVVALRPRPELTCVLEDTPPEVAIGFDFRVVPDHPEAPWIAALDRALGREAAEAYEWSGLNRLVVRPRRYGPLELVTYAHRSGRPAPVAKATVRVEVREPFGRAWIRFEPGLSSGQVDVALDVLFRFPHDVEVMHVITGPTAGVDGPPMASVMTERTFDSAANVRAEFAAGDLYPGSYVWDVVATGFGTFPAGRFRVAEDGGRIVLRNEPGRYVTGILSVRTPDVRAPIDVRVTDGRRSVTGHVFGVDDLGADREARWEYTVPRGSQLWAVAYVGQDLCSRPVTLDTTTPGAMAEMGEWVPHRVVTFRLRDDEPTELRLRWLDVRDAATGYRIVTRAVQGAPTVRLGLPEGDYAARVCWAGDRGAEHPFSVSSRTVTIVVSP